MSFKDIDFIWIIVFFIVAALIYFKVIKVRTGNPLRDKLQDMQAALIMSGALMLVMWLFMPQTASLSTFGYPEEVSEVDTPGEVLKYLQRYNDAITRTIDIVKWTMFITVFWLIATGYQVVKLFKDKLDKENT